MKRRSSITALSLIVLGGSCRPAEPLPVFDHLDPVLDSLAAEHGVPGYSFAVFDDRRVLHEQVGGAKNAETGSPVDSETVFEAASISKPLFGYIVLDLVRRGALALDTTIGKASAVVVELGHDPRAARLTPRMLLTHHGGLPNWRTRLNLAATSYDQLFPTDTLQFVVDPDTEYRYSGEGFVLLQRVVEEATGRELNALAREIVFGPLGMERSSFRFDRTMRENASDGHHRDTRPDKWEISLALASSTLHTTAPDLARFGVHLAAGIRDETAYAAIARPVVRVGADGDWTAHRGLGMAIVTDGNRRYVYHGGNNVIFIAEFLYGIEENLGYALLTNSANGRRMVNAFARRFFGRDIPRP